MLVEVIQLLSGKEYSFTTVMEEMDAELDASEVYKLVKEEAWREHKRTGRNRFNDRTKCFDNGSFNN